MDQQEIKVTEASNTCGPSCSMPDERDVKAAVRERYAQIARDQDSCCGPTGAARTNASRLYSPEELQTLPEGVAELALGCGNPTAIAGLRPGEVVLDLGSGGGIDCFLSAAKVGPQGRVIGLDMTPEMVLRARHNAQKLGLSNVEFRLGEMEAIPLPDSVVDVIISNCVINLSPDKDAVLGEAFRVLRAGGRLCVSDIVTLGPLPEAMQQDMAQWAGCVAGALDKDDYQSKLAAAGFVHIEMASKGDLDLSDWGSSVAALLIASFYITAQKPT